VLKESLESRESVAIATATLLSVPTGQPLPRTWRKDDARSARRSQVQVLGPALFRSALIRERKTADRSNQPFALLLLTLRDSRAFDVAEWDAAIASLAAVRRDIDVIGWLEPQAALGLILPMMATSPETVQQIEARVLRELSGRLDPTSAVRLSLRIHLHEPPARGAEAKSSSVDPLLSRIQPRPLGARANEALKRALDLVGSLTLIAVLSPVFLMIALAVKLTSKGPIFFKQERVGQASKRFKMLKFRSMRVNNDAAIHQKFVTEFINAGSKPNGEASESKIFKIVGDPRVTPVGHFLRRTSIDELPQLFNVVRGEMSLVGPRPPLPYEVEQYKAWHCRRVMEAKPGMTGLWQVSGRSRTTFDDMVRLDLRYAKASSPWMDVKILLATPKAVISGKGAC
jgi:lipopolysaccharide/colanic/teichoic acid biosynthesis glycosyltransferase